LIAGCFEAPLAIDMRGFDTLQEGWQVSFDVTAGNRGRSQAINIQAA